MGSRRFAEEVPEIETGESQEETSEIVSWMRTDEIGTDAVMNGPYGTRKVSYCDYTASGRAFSSIEQYIQHEVLPFYGNTHSSVTVTAEQTTLFMHEARQEIRTMTGAGDLDSVIFTGSGSTCAVELLVHLMKCEQDTVVVHSCQEHHSNLLPWRNLAKECFSVDELENGQVDLVDLQRVLTNIREKFGKVEIVGTFTACSNLTGIVIDVQKVTRLLKRFGAIAIWDFASAAPYIPIVVNGTDPLDAIFFSGHKFPGGVSSPGVLIVKKSLIRATNPKRIGGGTVFFVTENDEWYLKEVEHREEGGTADAVGAVRLAMAIKMKRAAGEETIAILENRISELTLRSLQSNSNIVLLGPPICTNRIPIFSFLVRDEKSQLFFHHNYISALLNDLFGVQTRAGCMCAGPYAQKLLGIDGELAKRFAGAIRESDQLDRAHLRRQAEYSQQEFLRPGFTRISFPYYFTIDQIKQILSAIIFVAEHAADFLHLYQVNCETGEWHHKNHRVFHGRRWLGHVQFTNRGLKVKPMEVSEKRNFKEYLAIAEALAKESANIELLKIPDGRAAIGSEHSDLRWFLLPIEEAEFRSNRNVRFPVCLISPRKYISQEILTSAPLDQALREDSDHVNLTGVVSEKVQLVNDSAVECKDVCDDVICLIKLDENSKKEVNFTDVGQDEKEAKEVKTMEDWNKRVIVTPVAMTKDEESHLEWHIPPLEMYKKVTDMVHQLKMIRDGDKVLVCLSGGKDSLSLLHILRYYQQRCNKAKSTSFTLGAITVDPGSAEYNPRPLIEYCRKLNLDYFYEEQDIIGAAKKTPGLRSICAFCSRMKRGRLAAAAQAHGWNVLAMGQHLDDLAESFFIAAFQNGNLSTMKAQYTTKDGTLRVIRPLVMVREKALRSFAEEKKLPIVAENCPACFNQATERHRVKQLLAQQELIFPDLFNSLRSALKPLLLVDSARTNEMRLQAVNNIVKNT